MKRFFDTGKTSVTCQNCDAVLAVKMGDKLWAGAGDYITHDAQQWFKNESDDENEWYTYICRDCGCVTQVVV